MNQKIEKAQKKLHEAIFDQERKKVRYDAHVIVAEGHRRQLSDIVAQNQKLMNDLMDSGESVKEASNQLKKITDEINNQQNEEQRKGVQ